MKILKVENITKIYPPNLTKYEKVALDNVSFEVEEGEFVTITGRSGAGKTTLLKIIGAQDRPTSGEVYFDGQPLSKIKNKDLYKIRQAIGFVFQDYRLLSYKTVFENIAFPLEVRGVDEKTIKNEVEQVLSLVNLEEQKDYFPKQLSGGEKQRTAIARAVISRPKLILADEPTGNLDPYHARDILKILLQLNELGMTIILSTHSKDLIKKLGKRVISLRDGKIIRDENPGLFIL